MRKSILAMILLMVSTVLSAQGELVLIVHQDSPVKEVSKRELIDIYMGRSHTLANGLSVEPVDYPETAPIKQLFYRSLVDRSLAQINAYWARLLFTGSAYPPRALTSSDEVMSTISNNTLAIGYTYADQVTGPVKIVARLEYTH